jgi:AraC-like DNA-binding protein
MKYLKYIIISFLLVFPTLLLSQSIKKSLAKFSYKELKESYWHNEKNKSRQINYAEAYLLKAKNENNAIEKARGSYLLSLVSENDKALQYLDSSINYTKNLNDTKYPAYAYSGKGYVYKKQYKYKEAIDNFLIAESIAKKNNPDLYYDTKFSIAVLRSEELGQVKEALTLYKECFDYYKDKKVRDSIYYFSYQIVLFGLADAYKTLNLSDSATYYNKLGYIESKITKRKLNNALFTLNEGANQAFKRNYKVALDSIHKALPTIIYYKDQGNTLAAYYYIAMVYTGLNNKKEAVKNFIRVDSIYNITKRITPEFVSGYPYLISYFKNNNDKENQLKFLTRYLYIDSILHTNYKDLTKQLQKEYDTPNLIGEKENLIKTLESDNTKSYWSIGILILLILVTIAIAFYQYKLKKSYHSRFEKIIQNSENANEIKISQKEQESKSDKSNPEIIGINEELINQILKKLNDFEVAKGFLETNITVQSLSEIFETNNKYVSRIVNVYKEKTFIQYINDLRIDYAVNVLKEDNKLQKYTIQALGIEFGFNSAESFSTAFYKKTGLKPTYFIKQLQELDKKHSIDI